MGNKFENELAAEFAKSAKNKGYQVYIAKSGHYGFYTDGTRVISFSAYFGGISLSGNYVTSNPSQTGTGWQIMEFVKDDSDIDKAIKSNAPYWATNGASWRWTTAEEHLKTYQKSSCYSKI